MNSQFGMTATNRDRMFLVMNGVHYELALKLDDSTVFRLAWQFNDLRVNGWIHPNHRTLGDLEETRVALLKVGDRSKPNRGEKVDIEALREAVVDATCCIVEVSQGQPYSPGDGATANVHHPKARIALSVTADGVFVS